MSWIDKSKTITLTECPHQNKIPVNVDMFEEFCFSIQRLLQLKQSIQRDHCRPIKGSYRNKILALNGAAFALNILHRNYCMANFQKVAGDNSLQTFDVHIQRFHCQVLVVTHLL